ncbi:hypothetical protein N7462_011549 [Penicillium macrosclerotiorum]|uniref:uncharacterized protein n=1 Tax=Penicillium macrosclerotiorum TaxID=303699 RepID=UPI002546ECD9|nr:uncharacterized protein N7462_011549 [Penicillium macrosclerotiorum]KAJ5664736.1 hypothetical protein N7462_011549 [Penicillium macrosclerotiorum]
MADETVAAPAVAVEQPELTPAADKTADQESENVPNSDDKPTENANATTEEKGSEVATGKETISGDAPKLQAEEDDVPAASEEAATAPDPNGTPASAKKSSKDRRRSSGVADKKSLSRKKSMSRIVNVDVKPGQYYLARLRSYAPWPSIICDEEMLPQSLLDTRPVTAAQSDGTYREDYADGGKRVHERTFPVMFFQTNEFAWIANSALTPLAPAECKEVSEKNKAKTLIGAYNIASEGHDLAYFKKLLSDHQAAIQQEIEEQEAEEAAKAAAKAEKEAKKKKSNSSKRKSKGADTDVDMEDADDSKKSKSSKKRKNEADGEADKPAKTPKTGTKLKLTTPKAPAEEKKTPASKTKKAATKKGKTAAEDATPEAKEPEKQVDPEELKKKKEKEVLFLRHKLQKGFISRDQPPKEDEMAAMATYFDKLEKHADLEVSIIRSTKINKVLKMIVKLDSIPRDEEFNFRHRAMNILTSWKSVLETDAPIASADKDSKSTPNGTHKDEDGADTPKLETEEEKEPETKAANEDTPMADADEAPKVETTESDKPADKKLAEESAVDAVA